MYKAKHYVRVNGKTYTRGETLPDGLPAENIAWYMEKGAIEEVAPSYAPEDTVPEPEEEPEPEQPEEAEAPEEEPAEEPEEEPDEEAEAPEIDVMAGIVGDEQEETPKKTARKTAAKKTTGRRKTK